MRSNSQRPRALRLALAGATLTAALAVSGCSASYWPDLSPKPEVTTETEAPVVSNLAPVPVTQDQIQSIIDGVAEAATAGDEGLDPAALEGRFLGDALEQRTANYKIRSQVSDYASTPATITNSLLQYQLIQSTEAWPRTLLVTVASEAPAPAEGEKAADAPSLALVLTQRIPQENFQVSRIISLRGGIEMPQAAPAAEGTALLSDDLESLVLKPGSVGSAYAAILQGGVEVPEAAPFDLTDDPLIENYGQAWVAKSAAKSQAEDKSQQYSVSVEQGPEQIVSLSTGVGGALVATTVIESQVVDSAGGRYKPQAEGAVSALSGLSGQQDRIVRRVAHQLLFFVPSKLDGSKIQLLGVTSELVGAGN